MAKNDFKDIFCYFGLITQLGLTMVVLVFIGVKVGGFLDEKIGLNGVFLIICTLLGIISGGVASYRLIFRKDKKDEGIQ
ncbi:MAG: AtpZ/AtpI family protein [bacterium]|nr:AtpZ/AtpI family protein [bacterium]